jgi:hypothetical protein
MIAAQDAEMQLRVESQHRERERRYHSPSPLNLSLAIHKLLGIDNIARVSLRLPAKHR